jgi:hypothetical protein
MTAKPTGSTPTVNAALVHRQFALKVNVAKSQVAPMSECAFLGFTIKGKKIRWTYKALADFKHRIKELTGRSWGVSMEYRLRMKLAIQHGCSSNSYWQMSRTPVINQAISNAWLQEQGLLSVKDLWCKAQGYTAKKGKSSSSVPTC